MSQVRKRSFKKITIKGLSLIEVLVAIAILTVGMLAILILFPAGLVTLTTAANSTNADRLGQAELEKSSNSQLQLLGAVYSNDDVTADVNPVNFIQNATLALTSSGGYLTNQPAVLTNGSDVDAFRSIVGETVRVPAPNAAGNSLYTVICGPIESGPNLLTVNGTPWEGISGDSSGSTSNSSYSDPNSDLAPGQPQYLVDYANGEIALSPENTTTLYPQTIVFTVTSSTTSPTVTTLTVQVPGADCGQWHKLSDFDTVVNGTVTTTLATEPTIPWTAGSDVLVRNFTQLNQGGTFNSTSFSSTDPDPYQYQLYLPDYTAVNSSEPSANLGVIAFNPLASQLHGANGQPLEAVISYKTYDWHIISEDRLVTAAEGTTRLSLTSLLAVSAKDKLTDNSTAFDGLFTYSGGTTNTNPQPSGTADPLGNPDFIILDMDTGNVLTEGTDYTVNYPSGTVSFLGTGPSASTYVNDHLRIFYHPADDWGVALARAPVVYYSDTTSATPALGSYVAPTTGSPTLITFPLVDVGKQVNIRFQYSYTPAGGISPTTAIAEGLYTIVSEGSNSAGVDVNSTTSQVSAIPSGLTVTSITPLTVKGVSLSAIVIWKANGIWHNRTISTVLPTLSQSSATNM